MSARRDERRSRPRQKDQATGVLPLVPLVPGALKPPAPNMPPGPAPPPGPPGAPWNRPETPSERLRREFREQEEAADRRRAVENVDFKGGKYTGSVVDGVPDGFGTYEFVTQIQSSRSDALSFAEDAVEKAKRDAERNIPDYISQIEALSSEYRNGAISRGKYTSGSRALRQKMQDAEELVVEMRAKREALRPVTEDQISEMWASFEKYASGKRRDFGLGTFVMWSNANKQFWPHLRRPAHLSLNQARDLVYAPIFFAANVAIVMKKTDSTLTEDEFRGFFEKRKKGEVALDVRESAPTVSRFISYEGFWSNGEVVGMGKMDVADEIGVNTELSGSFGPGFVPIQVDMVSYTRNGDKLVVYGLTMVDGRWVGSSGAKGANAVGVWKLSPPGTVRFDGDSDLKSGIFLKAELSGKVALEFDTGEKITANVQGPANSFKVEGEVKLEIDGIKYAGVVTGYGADGKPLVRTYDTNPPPPPQKTATIEERARRRARAQGANAKADSRKEEAEKRRQEIPENYDAILNFRHTFTPEGPRTYKEYVEDRRRAEEFQRQADRMEEMMRNYEKYGSNGVDRSLVTMGVVSSVVLGVLGYAVYQELQSQLCPSVITDDNFRRFIKESISEYSWEGGSEIDFEIHPVLQKPISEWDVSRVTDFFVAFSSCRGSTMRNPADLDLSNWEVQRVENADGMLMEMKDFNSDLSAWNVVRLKSANDMFRGCLEFDSDISNWKVGRLQFADQMFLNCRALDSDVSGWNVANLKSYSAMFQGTALSKRIDEVTDAWPPNIDTALLTRGKARRAKSPVR